MKKEIDIFGWAYRPSAKEMQIIQAIMVFTVMCLILSKGISSLLTLRLLGIGLIGLFAYFYKLFF